MPINRKPNEDHWRDLGRWVVFAADEGVVVGALIVGVLLVLVYYLSLVSVRNALIRRLEKRLKHASNDKVFLMNQRR